MGIEAAVRRDGPAVWDGQGYQRTTGCGRGETETMRGEGYSRENERR